MPDDRALLERQMADVEVRSFTLDEFHRRRHQKQRNRRIATAAMGLALAAVVAGSVGAVVSDDGERTITADDPGAAHDAPPRDEVGPVLEPPSPFVGSWESIGEDGSSQTLVVRYLGGEDRHEIVLRDEGAAACSGAASTVTGTGRRQTGAGWRPGLVELVIPAELTCDDGTRPRIGSELREALAHVSFVHDPVTEELIDTSEVVWRRPGATRNQGDPTATLQRLADALTAGDADAFRDVFSPDGVFNPRGEFASSEQPFANIFTVSEARLVGVWVAINETWGFEADLRSCSSVSAPRRRYSTSTDVFIECAVTARWTELSLEITDGWRFALRGSRLVDWDVAPLDLDPADRTMPLGYPGLEAWEAWLATTHPDDAARWLNPRSEPADEPATLSWVIDGERFTPEGLIPYDPAYVDEISASIDEYLEEQ